MEAQLLAFAAALGALALFLESQEGGVLEPGPVGAVSSVERVEAGDEEKREKAQRRIAFMTFPFGGVAGPVQDGADVAVLCDSGLGRRSLLRPRGPEGTAIVLLREKAKPTRLEVTTVRFEGQDAAQYLHFVKPLERAWQV